MFSLIIENYAWEKIVSLYPLKRALKYLTWRLKLSDKNAHDLTKYRAHEEYVDLERQISLKRIKQMYTLCKRPIIIVLCYVEVNICAEELKSITIAYKMQRPNNNKYAYKCFWYVYVSKWILGILFANKERDNNYIQKQNRGKDGYVYWIKNLIDCFTISPLELPIMTQYKARL